MSYAIVPKNMIPVPKVPRLLPKMRSGSPVHISTIMRWIHDGVRDANGNRVRLAAWRLGQRWCTTPEAISRFIAATTCMATGPVSPQLVPTPERVEAELSARGL
jgi:hypothetical protein